MVYKCKGAFVKAVVKMEELTVDRRKNRQRVVSIVLVLEDRFFEPVYDTTCKIRSVQVSIVCHT